MKPDVQTYAFLSAYGLQIFNHIEVAFVDSVSFASAPVAHHLK